jgi:large subunit ribosomal protein L25
MSQDNITIALEPRSVTGKAVKHLRNEGTLPAVIHDHGKDSILVQGSYNELVKVWKTAGKHHPVEIKAGDKKYTALIKVADFDPKKHTLTHLSF